MATFPEFLTSFDLEPAKRGKQFEHFVRWFLKNDPEWATQVDQVFLWEEYPDRWGIDCGIDLVFRHKNGETWAVQAKCYSAEHDITKQDVDKFLSESNRKGIDKRLLIATTDRIGANAKQVCEAQEKSVVRYLLSNFETADVDYPASIAELHKAKPKDKPQPRNHQLEAIAAVTLNFQNTDRGQLIMACGTGKTFTTLWIKEQLSANSVLVLLPSLGLLSQTLHEWTLAANQSFDVLCVCSDQTVGKKGADEAIHTVADLAFPVTSDTTAIRRFLQRDGARVVFSTYQSSPLIAEAQADHAVQQFDLAIADEAHRCVGKVGSDFSTVLDSNRIRAKKRLFTTATPRTYSTRVTKAAEDRGVEVIGMDDETVFGKVLYALPFGSAIKRGLLTDYRVVIIGVDNPTIAEWIANRELLKTDSGIENDAESLASQIGLLKAFKDYDLRRVISFHSRVNRAESFSQDLQLAAEWIGAGHKPSGTLKTDFVSGAMPTDKRRRKLAQLKALGADQRGLLSNARCLSEGVDVPSLDGVAFIDPRSSQIDIIQAVGRAIRLSPDKKAGTIVLPVFVSDGDNPAESIEASNFKPIWDVLNALKAHDDVLSAELDQIRTELGRKAGSKVNTDALSKITIDLPSSVDQAFGDSLRTCLVERVTESWDSWYGSLQAYSEEQGDCLVPQSYDLPNGLNLGRWVSKQRGDQFIMQPDRRARLESLPGWSWEARDAMWETGFQYLSEYSVANGHCSISKSYKLQNGYRLGEWVGVQRKSQSKNSAERRMRLESIPGWTWDPVGEAWEVGYCHLSEYGASKGDCAVSVSYELPNGYKLGVWVRSQRGNQSKLSQQRKARLESLPGWSWDPYGEAWETGCQHLAEYCSANGDCLVASSHVLPDGFRLGGWVLTQRANQSTLSPNRKARLESLPGWTWDTRDSKWETGFQYLYEYSKTFGHCAVPKSYTLPNGYKLGIWVSNLRKRRPALTIEDTVRVESLPGWSWEMRDAKWETGFQHLCEYCQANGHSRVPQSYKLPNGYKLGIWVNTQRNQSSHSPERRSRLESLPGWSWDPLNDAWETGFRHMSDYSLANGNCLVPALYELPNGFRLGGWVNIQRTRQSKLSPERRMRLESIPGWIWKVKV